MRCRGSWSHSRDVGLFQVGSSFAQRLNNRRSANKLNSVPTWWANILLSLTGPILMLVCRPRINFCLRKKHSEFLGASRSTGSPWFSHSFSWRCHHERRIIDLDLKRDCHVGGTLVGSSLVKSPHVEVHWNHKGKSWKIPFENGWWLGVPPFAGNHFVSHRCWFYQIRELLSKRWWNPCIHVLMKSLCWFGETATTCCYVAVRPHVRRSNHYSQQWNPSNPMFFSCQADESWFNHHVSIWKTWIIFGGFLSHGGTPLVIIHFRLGFSLK